MAGLPDIAKATIAREPARLSWVGMKGIKIPMSIVDKNLGEQKIQASIDCSVDLNDPRKRGIHMSRMYLSVTAISKLAGVDYATLKKLSNDLIKAQGGCSTSSLVSISFELFISRQSLLSDNQGWASYPVKITLQNKKGKVKCQMDIQVLYSSTCPCSAALARQLISQRFAKYFSALTPGIAPNIESVQDWLMEEEKLMATPHSQRSIAYISLVFDSIRGKKFPIQAMIDRAEEAIKTPVQTVVKREDEQAFASINGENLMFCEDSVRILLDGFENVDKTAISIKVHHMESLHAHDATAEITQGDLILPT